MTHDDMNELYELYVLGVLDRESALEIDSHLTDSCDYCAGRVRQAALVLPAIGAAADSVAAPKRLRNRIVEIGRPVAGRQRWLSVAFPAVSAVCAALAIFAVWAGYELKIEQHKVELVAAEREKLRSAILLLTKSDMRAVRFGAAAEPHGHVLLSSSGGLVFVGTELPNLAKDRTFELWVIPTTGSPVPAGLFRPTSLGESVTVAPSSVDMSRAKAVAVTVEPLVGSATPTTTPFLVVPVA